MAEDRTTKQEWERLARLLYQALDGIFIEELNGRICAMPDGLPDEGNRSEIRACKSCWGHWRRTQEALREFEKVVPRKCSAVDSSATADDFEVVREAVRFASQPELDRALTALERIEANRRAGRIVHGDA